MDRDGTIIEHVPYIKDPAKVELKKGMAARIQKYQENGYLVIVITNQSGIARGLITQDEYEEVNCRMIELLAAEGVKIDAIYMCPSHPDAGDKRRKPEPGMIFEAAEKFGIDLGASIIVGDDEKDLEAGRRANVGRGMHIEEFLRE